MPGSKQKRRTLLLGRWLWERTDENHPLTVQELGDLLAEHGIRAERKSIYADLEALFDAGLDVRNRKGRHPGWYIGTRPFRLSELKLLADAVESCPFLTRRRGGELLRKLGGLCSLWQAEQLRRPVCLAGRVRTMDESAYYSLDRLHAAIGAERAVTFRMFLYNREKGKEFRQGGRRYTVSPWAILRDGDFFYLVGYDHARRTLRRFRVDQMEGLAVTCLERQGEDLFRTWDPEAHEKKPFGLSGGREGEITLRCENRLAGAVLDRLGLETSLEPDGANHFTAVFPAVVNAAFFGWLLGLGPGVELRAPDWAAEAYRARLAEALAPFLNNDTTNGAEHQGDPYPPEGKGCKK